MRRNRSPKRRIIKFGSREAPELMPWFASQRNEKNSIYMLIRMAQEIGGNTDWPTVVQKLADQSIWNGASNTRQIVSSRVQPIVQNANPQPTQTRQPQSAQVPRPRQTPKPRPKSRPKPKKPTRAADQSTTNRKAKQQQKTNSKKLSHDSATQSELKTLGIKKKGAWK